MTHEALVVDSVAEWSRDGQLCGHSRMRWRQCVVFIPLEREKNSERGRDPEQCSALQRGVGGGGVGRLIRSPQCDVKLGL
jgi:hypothetical protein